MATYDKKYKQENLFGKPYSELVNFFESLNTRGDALDLGCGQGRDSLFLASLGYKVTGVDISKVGISQMLDKAKKSNLDINGAVGNFFDFNFTQKYDLVILDSVLHFSKIRDKEEELLKKIADHTSLNGLICIFIRRSSIKEKYLKDAFDNTGSQWKIVIDKYIDYVYEEKASNFRSHSKFKMFIAQKIS